jgi:hypothetical protein
MNGVVCVPNQGVIRRTARARILNWKGVAVQRGLEPGSRGVTIVRSHYQATTSEDTAVWKRQRDFVKSV